MSPSLYACADGRPYWVRVRTLVAYSGGVAVGKDARAWRNQDVRLRRSAEGECAPKNRSRAKYLGVDWGRAVPRADSPLLKTEGVARQQSRDASFGEACGKRERSRIPGKTDVNCYKAFSLRKQKG